MIALSASFAIESEKNSTHSNYFDIEIGTGFIGFATLTRMTPCATSYDDTKNIRKFNES